jgi:hypothetical protein
MKTITIPAAMAVFSCVLSGCVTHTTVKDELRQTVRFTSPQAAQTFYDAYLSVNSPKGNGSVVLYAPLPYWRRAITTDNVRFNAAVGATDSNRDSTISDDEAQSYAAKIRRQVSPAAKVVASANSGEPPLVINK